MTTQTRRRRWLVVLISIIAVLAGAYLSTRRHGEFFALGEPSAPDTVAKTIRTQVVALGRIEPKSRVVEVSAPPGAIVRSLAVNEGMAVAADAALARLEDYPRRLAERDQAAARLREARALRTAETLYYQASIRKTKIEIAKIEALVPLQIRSQEATVARLDAELDNATAKLERLKQLHTNDNVADQEIDDQIAAQIGLSETRAAARLKLARLKAKRDFDRRALEQSLDMARASLNRSQLVAHVESLKAALATANAALEDAVIRAPLGGTVFKVLTHPGERVGEDPNLLMGNTEQMIVVAEIYETDARFVHHGQRATITSAALGEPLQGTVERVSRLVFKNDLLDVDPAAPVDARVIEVYIRLDDSRLAGRFNYLQVRVRIDLESVTGRSDPPLAGRPA